MKKYYLLFSFCLILVVCISQIPNISNQLAEECYTLSVVNGEAIESVSCKGVIEEAYDGFIARVQISEEDINRVKVGQMTEVSCKALGKKTLRGKVKELSNYAYKVVYGGVNITVIDAVIDFEEDYEGLKSGYSVTAEIIYTELKNANILPFEGVAQEKNGRYYVYRIDDNWAVKEYVDIAFEDEKGAVVLGECNFKTICEEPQKLSGDFVMIKNVGDN